jgi:predicted RNA-binding protein YlxR (DUF448 family)
LTGRHVPIRTCIACLKARPKSELLRFVLGPSGIEVGKHKGRGFYVCRSAACLELAAGGKNVKRFLGRHLSASEIALLSLRISGQNHLDGGCGGGVKWSDCIGGGVVA